MKNTALENPKNTANLETIAKAIKPKKTNLYLAALTWTFLHTLLKTSKTFIILKNQMQQHHT